MIGYVDITKVSRRVEAVKTLRVQSGYDRIGSCNRLLEIVKTSKNCNLVSSVPMLSLTYTIGRDRHSWWHRGGRRAGNASVMNLPYVVVKLVLPGESSSVAVENIASLAALRWAPELLDLMVKRIPMSIEIRNTSEGL